MAHAFIASKILRFFSKNLIGMQKKLKESAELVILLAF